MLIRSDKQVHKNPIIRIVYETAFSQRISEQLLPTNLRRVKVSEQRREWKNPGDKAKLAWSICKSHRNSILYLY